MRLIIEAYAPLSRCECFPVQNSGKARRFVPAEGDAVQLFRQKIGPGGKFAMILKLYVYAPIRVGHEIEDLAKELVRSPKGNLKMSLARGRTDARNRP